MPKTLRQEVEGARSRALLFLLRVALCSWRGRNPTVETGRELGRTDMMGAGTEPPTRTRPS